MISARHDRLMFLLEALCENRLPSHDEAELERWVLDDQEARRHYVRYMYLHSGLGSLLGTATTSVVVENSTAGCDDAADDAPTLASRLENIWTTAYDLFRQPMTLSLVVAGLFTLSFVLSLALITVPLVKSSGLPEVASKPEFVARIVASREARWSAASQVTENEISDIAVGQQLELLAGMAQLQFDSGVSVWVEAPSRLRIDALDRVELQSGALLAEVPAAAVGFQVDTEAAELVDLGTRFGAAATSSGKTELTVFSGKVRAFVSTDIAGERSSFDLQAGESMVFQTGFAPKVADGAVERKFSSLLSFERLPRHTRWQRHMEQWRDDPALVAAWWFTTDDVAQHLLANQAKGSEGRHDGQITGARWHTGRWTSKPSLRFRGAGTEDRVEIAQSEGSPFDFQGEFTISLWLRIPKFDHDWQAVIAKGDDSWRIARDRDTNFLAFDTSHPGKDTSILATTVEMDDDRWHHVMAVYREGDGRVHKQLYLDGQLNAEWEQEFPPIIRDADPVWLGGNAQHPDRTFNGYLDEVLVFNRTLSAEEARTLYEAGKP